MTIDSTWLHSFKAETREAFTKKAPFQHTAVFTDGQIRLMQGGASRGGLQTWDEYIRRQFLLPLSRFLDTCDTVILAFDCYDHVPPAKCMTQLKRRRHIPPTDFGEHSCLPPSVPQGEAWAGAISNRSFKAKVIELVLLSLPAWLLKDRPEKRLIVDYTAPTAMHWDAERRLVVRQEVDGLPPLGEADVKFTRYADLYQRLMVDSIDGDSVPIALLHHERCLAVETCPPRVSIYRLELKEREPPPPREKKGVKRKSPEPAREKQAGASKRTYEYVDVQCLYQALRTAVLQSIGRTHLPLHAGHEIRMLMALVCLTGTDFSRGLPQISGRTVYDLLPRIWMTLVLSYDPAVDLLRPEDGADRLVALLYHEKFAKHAPSRRGLRAVLAELQASGISQRTKDTLPQAERIEATVRNVNWVLQYWRCADCPDPVDAAFGYRRTPQGLTQYADA